MILWTFCISIGHDYSVRAIMNHSLSYKDDTVGKHSILTISVVLTPACGLKSRSSFILKTYVWPRIYIHAICRVHMTVTWWRGRSASLNRHRWAFAAWCPLNTLCCAAHCALAALTNATPFCWYQVRRLALCAFMKIDRNRGSYLEISSVCSEVDGDERQPDDTRGVHGKRDILGFVEILRDLPRLESVDGTEEDEHHIVH